MIPGFEPSENGTAGTSETAMYASYANILGEYRDAWEGVQSGADPLNTGADVNENIVSDVNWGGASAITFTLQDLNGDILEELIILYEDDESQECRVADAYAWNGSYPWRIIPERILPAYRCRVTFLDNGYMVGSWSGGTYDSGLTFYQFTGASTDSGQAFEYYGSGSDSATWYDLTGTGNTSIAAAGSGTIVSEDDVRTEVAKYTTLSFNQYDMNSANIDSLQNGDTAFLTGAYNYMQYNGFLWLLS